ncbi:rhomboid protein 2 [Monosporozyma unispora]|nr:putative rhomboid protease [Kazachstania unispora]
MSITRFLKLYEKPFGVFSSAYLLAATLAFLWCRYSEKWAIDTAYSPSLLLQDIILGQVFDILPRITGYPLDTTRSNIFHFLLNVILLLPGLSQFEKIFGTLHGFFFLGLVTPVVGVIFGIVGLLWCPHDYIYGIHLWNCIIWGYFIVQESKLGATIRIFKTSWRIPIAWTPLIVLSLVSYFTSFVVTPMVLCLLMGYSLPVIKGILDFFLPPTALFNYVEEKLFGNNKGGAHFHVRYYREVYVKKGKKYKSIFAESSGLPKTKKVSKNKGKLKSKNKK